MNKCKLLFLAANPSDTSPLALDEECRAIDQRIRASEYRDQLEQVTKWAVRPEDLLQYLNQYQPHVVHFSGHGSATEEIVLQDAARQSKPLSTDALRSLFATLKDNVRVVVLNACYSRPQAQAITEVIDCAIGMNRAIGDVAAIAFAAAFYGAVASGRSVQEAFDQGRTELLLEGIPEEHTPELLVRDGVAASSIYLVLNHGRERVARRRSAIVVFVAVIAALTIWGARYLVRSGRFFRHAKPGELLFIVAQFKHSGALKTDARKWIVSALDGAINNTGMGNARIQQVPEISYESEALKIGHSHGAVFVIWGQFDGDGFESVFTVTRKLVRPVAGGKTTLAMDDEVKGFKSYIVKTLPARMNALAALVVGQVFYNEGKPDSALVAFALADSSKSLAPADLATLRFYQELAYLERGEVGRVIRSTSEAIARDSGNARAFYALGLALSSEEKFDSALASFDKAIAIDSRNSDFYNARGDLRYRRGDSAQALSDFSRAIRLEPEASLAYFNRGVVREAMGEVDNALTDYSKAIELDPFNPSAFNNRGNIEEERGHLGSAFADFDRAIALSPRYGTAYLNRGIAHFDRRSYIEAIADYSTAIAIDSTDDLAHNNRGNAYRVRGKRDSAEWDLNRATSLNPGLADAYLNRGLLYLELGPREKARTEFEKYLLLRPNAKDRSRVEGWLHELKLR